MSLVIGASSQSVVSASSFTAAPKLVGGFGDSRIALSYANTSGIYDMLRNLGSVHWIQAWSQGVITMPKALNGGVAGDTTVMALARQDAYIALCQSLGCKRVFVCIATNDRGIYDLGTTKKNVREIIRRFLAAGITPYLMSETPRGTGSSQYELKTQDLRNEHYQYHLWCERVMSRMCKIVSVWNRWIDPASGEMYYPKAEMTIDGIHGSKEGGNEMGQAGAAVIAADIAQLPDLLESNTVFDAINNPLGSLVANPLLLGTSGTWQNGYVPVAGSQVADSWNCSVENFSGTRANSTAYALTVKASKEVDDDGVTWQRFDVSGTTGADQANLNMNQTIDMSQLSNGDVMKATALVKSQGEGISNMALQDLMTPIYQLKSDAEDSDSSFPWPSAAIGPLSREMPSYTKTASDSVTGMELKVVMQFALNATVSASFWIAQCGPFKVDY